MKLCEPNKAEILSGTRQLGLRLTSLGNTCFLSVGLLGAAVWSSGSRHMLDFSTYFSAVLAASRPTFGVWSKGL